MNNDFVSNLSKQNSINKIVTLKKKERIENTGINHSFPNKFINLILEGIHRRAKFLELITSDFLLSKENTKKKLPNLYLRITRR